MKTLRLPILTNHACKAILAGAQWPESISCSQLGKPVGQLDTVLGGTCRAFQGHPSWGEDVARTQTLSPGRAGQTCTGAVAVPSHPWLSVSPRVKQESSSSLPPPQ